MLKLNGEGVYVVLEVKRAVEKYRFLGKNANIWHKFCYHSVRNGIKTGKDLEKRILHPMYAYTHIHT